MLCNKKWHTRTKIALTVASQFITVNQVWKKLFLFCHSILIICFDFSLANDIYKGNVYVKSKLCKLWEYQIIGLAYDRQLDRQWTNYIFLFLRLICIGSHYFSRLWINFWLFFFVLNSEPYSFVLAQLHLQHVAQQTVQ